MSALTIVQERSKKAIKDVSKVLDRNYKFERLSYDQVLAKSKNYVVGWTTVEEVPDIGSRLEVYLPKFFPDQPPEIYLTENPERWYLKTPHIEEDGKVCIFAESAAIDADIPVKLLSESLERALTILTKASEDDFRDEALIYWRRSDDCKYEALCCSPVSELSLNCVIGLANKSIVLAKDEETANKWIKNWKGIKASFESFSPCIVVQTEEALIPSTYPESYADVRNIVQSNSPEAITKFDDMTCKGSQLFCVVFLQNTKEGMTLAGVVGYGQNLDKENKYTKGFRPGKTPSWLLQNRSGKFFQKQMVNKISIMRADAEWIHSRGGSGLNLTDKTVTLIGCGSLGSYVGHLLGRTGIGKICLLDNDTIGLENVGRHLLGADEVGKSKSSALAERLRRELPHLQIIDFEGDWREWIEDIKGEELFSESDLVISTVADWRCERPLNLTIRQQGLKNVIYAWLEPFGLAAQVLKSGPGGGCLECGMDGLGKFSHRVLDFKDGSLRKEPGGCAYYQQYGPTKIFPLAALIVDSAIERLTSHENHSELLTILGDLNTHAQYGAKIRDDYREHVKSRLTQTIRRSWPKQQTCDCCKR
ncbi:MAG: ThiF family adenylyltransferase [Opitutales bacterium]|nr:ThiF family adenylyltransferase [Opitutales bacterium]